MSSNLKKYTLSDAAEVLTGFPFKGNKYSNDGIRVVRGENVTIGTLRWDTIKCWNEPFKEMEKYSLDEGDIVIGMDGSRVGKNRAQIRKDDLPLILAQRVARLRAKGNFSQDFLAYVIKSKLFEQYVDAIKTGTSIPHISPQANKGI
jgi:type I restriction enzyme S subunit